MRIFKSNGSTKIHQPLEREIGQNIQNLTHTTFRHPENRGDEISTNDLGARFLRLTEASTREIEILIEQLLNLREKLDSDGDRIKDYFARYEDLSQGAFQLTTIISDNVKRLSPGVPSNVIETDSPSVIAEAATPCPEAAPGAPSSVNETDSPSVVAEAATPGPEPMSLSSE
jgi:hypothetical protein